MTPVFFKHKSEFRSWLEKNHKTEPFILVGFYKIQTGKPSMTWSESVDQAICFGWIDGVRKSIDNESYFIRFTPRKPDSIWSAVNIDKIERLKQEGLMMQAGLDAYEKRKAEKSRVYSFENDEKQLPTEYETIFIKNANAWDYFQQQAPSYRKTIIHWILSAKTEKTKLSRLDKLINESKNKKRLWGK